MESHLQDNKGEREAWEGGPLPLEGAKEKGASSELRRRLLNTDIGPRGPRLRPGKGSAGWGVWRVPLPHIREGVSSLPPTPPLRPVMDRAALRMSSASLPLPLGRGARLV